MALELKAQLAQRVLETLLEAVETDNMEVLDLQLTVETVRAKDEDGWTVHEPTGRHFLHLTYRIVDGEPDGEGAEV